MWDEEGKVWVATMLHTQQHFNFGTILTHKFGCLSDDLHMHARKTTFVTDAVCEA